MTDTKEKLTEKSLKSILENLFFSVAIEKPKDIIQYSCDWLRSKGNLNSNGMSEEELKELSQLRLDLNQESDVSDVSSSYESSDDESEIGNSRKLLLSQTKRRNAICSEVVNFATSSLNIPITVTHKSDYEKIFLKYLLLSSIVFQHISLDYLDLLIDSAKIIVVDENEMIILENEVSYNLYIVYSGELEAFKRGQLVNVYSPGSILLEEAVLYSCISKYSIIAKRQSKLFMLECSIYSRVVMTSNIKRQNYYQSLLANVELFRNLSQNEISDLIDNISGARYKAGDIVFKEGDFGELLYIIEEGQAVASRKIKDEDVIVEYYGKNDYFGELSLVTSAPRLCSIIAKSDIKVATLNRTAFKNVVGSLSKELMKYHCEEDADI